MSPTPTNEGALARALPALDEPEGERVPAGLPAVVDAHVHLFPDWLFDAVWRWFDRHGWPIRHKLYTPGVLDFLFSHGVDRVVALTYSHKPGLARELNHYMSEVCRREPRVVGLATVLPGEPGAASILEEAFAKGLAGVKLHCHVQCFAPDAAELDEIYRICSDHGKPIVMHAGREPKSPAYQCDPHMLCSAERIERVLTRYPALELCIPHLGMDEFDAYRRLLETHDNLWLDTTMTLTDYFERFGAPWRLADARALIQARPDRILYGTDFPNIPLAWDHELLRLLAFEMPKDALAKILSGTATRLFGLEPLPDPASPRASR